MGSHCLRPGRKSIKTDPKQPTRGCFLEQFRLNFREKNRHQLQTGCQLINTCLVSVQLTIAVPLPISPLPSRSCHSSSHSSSHCLCTAYSLPIHCLFTAYSLPIHCLFTDGTSCSNLPGLLKHVKQHHCFRPNWGWRSSELLPAWWTSRDRKVTSHVQPESLRSCFDLWFVCTSCDRHYSVSLRRAR
jgi:hypothetical protein